MSEGRLDLPWPSGRQLVALRVFAVFACGFFLSYGFRTVNAALAPRFIADLSLTAQEVGLLTSTYFASFALFQLPLGVLLDRFGPRRVESILLLFAAAGSALFALAGSLSELAIARLLIGLGVSACLMGALKANTIWFPAARLPLANGALMAFGGLGAVFAGAPAEELASNIGWRAIFLAFAGVTVAVAVALRFAVPERPAPGSEASLSEHIRGLRAVYGSAFFWSLAPLTMLSQGSYMAMQTLWAGPWLRAVNGLSGADAARHISAISIAMVIGYLLSGAAAERLARRGIKTASVAAAGMAAFLAIQTLLFADPALPTLAIWFVYGLLGSTGVVSYAALAQAFPTALAGRVTTALTLLMFAAAFALQAGFGYAVEVWRAVHPEASPTDAHRTAMLGLIILQSLALGWFFARRRSSRVAQDPGAPRADLATAREARK